MPAMMTTLLGLRWQWRAVEEEEEEEEAAL